MGDRPDHRQLPRACVPSIDRLHAICPGSDVEVPRLPEVEKHRPGLVEQGENPHRPIVRDQLEIRHAASQKRVSLSKIVMKIKT
jgi:hypothetical protein